MADEKRTDTHGIEKVSVNPDYLAQYVEEDQSLDALKECRVVPRFKIVQSQTDADLKAAFGEGTVIVRPGDAMICKHKEDPKSFDFVPLFFFKEWAKWRDLKGSGPMVLDRSFDPTSGLAKLSASADTRKELYPGHEALSENERLYNQYVEHIRFIGVIYGEHPLVGTPVTLSFERGEWGQGVNFISAISLRRETINEQPRPIPLWAQVWRLGVLFHDQGQAKKWYGFSFESAPQGIVNPEDAAGMRALHLEFKELFEKSQLLVDDEATDDPTAEEAGAVPENSEF